MNSVNLRFVSSVGRKLNQMNNDFDRQVLNNYFCFNYKCWKCGQNHQDCLHHILKRVSNSPFNAAPLNNWNCHLNDPAIHTKETQTKYLQMTFDFLINEGYKPTKKDLMFLENYQQYYDLEKLKKAGIEFL